MVCGIGAHVALGAGLVGSVVGSGEECTSGDPGELAVVFMMVLLLSLVLFGSLIGVRSLTSMSSPSSSS